MYLEAQNWSLSLVVCPLWNKTVQTNEVYAVTCKRDHGCSIIMQTSCLQLRLVMFWLTYQSCWTMHSETFFPLVFVFITFWVCFFCHHSLTQTHWNISVTDAVKEFFFSSDNLSTIGAFNIFYASSWLNKITFSHRSAFGCIASNLSKYRTKQLQVCCVMLHLSGLFPTIISTAKKDYKYVPLLIFSCFCPYIFP